MQYNFPRVKFADDGELWAQLAHVRSEAAEVEAELLDAVRTKIRDKVFHEIADLQHSVETLVRIAQERHGMEPAYWAGVVIQKNRARGYYNNEP